MNKGGGLIFVNIFYINNVIAFKCPLCNSFYILSASHWLHACNTYMYKRCYMLYIYLKKYTVRS